LVTNYELSFLVLRMPGAHSKILPD